MAGHDEMNRNITQHRSLGRCSVELPSGSGDDNSFDQKIYESEYPFFPMKNSRKYLNKYTLLKKSQVKKLLSFLPQQENYTNTFRNTPIDHFKILLMKRRQDP